MNKTKGLFLNNIKNDGFLAGRALVWAVHPGYFARFMDMPCLGCGSLISLAFLPAEGLALHEALVTLLTCQAFCVKIQVLRLKP